MTEIPIVVSTNEITVGGVVDQIELQLGLGEKGDRGSRIFSGDVSPLTLPANSPFFAGYTEFKSGDVYVERSATNIAMWEWKSQPGGYTWVKTADIAVSGGGGITSLDPDLTAIGNLTGTSGLLRKSGINNWVLDTNNYLTSNQSISISGDATGSGTTAIALTLANVNSNTGTWGTASSVPAITVNAKGLVTAASNTSIQIAQSQVTSLVSDLSLKSPLASPAFTGTPTAPTAAVDTNTTQIATTAYVVGQGYLKSAAASSTYLPLAGGTLTGKLNAVASSIGTAGLRLPHGATPTTPSDGDVWTTTAGMYVRISGSTIGPFGTGATWGSITGTLSSQTDLNTALSGKQPLDADLTAIAALAGTSGLLKKTAADTWTLDTATYLTANQTITLSGVVTGSGTTAITTAFATSPAFTGTPTAPTAAVDTNTTQIATTAYVVGQGYLKSATASSTYLPLSGGTVTGNINMNSANPSFIVSGTSGGTSVYIDAVPGQWSQVMFRNYTGYKNRWALWKDNVSESGSNAGSDLWLTRYDDNGSSLGEVFGVYRATGKITFRAVDSSAGLELGSNGPRIMVGTGTPEGSVTAPVGSEWTDTNTGIKYAKMAGTSNTGWAPRLNGAGYVEDSQVYMMMGAL